MSPFGDVDARKSVARAQITLSSAKEYAMDKSSGGAHMKTFVLFHAVAVAFLAFTIGFAETPVGPPSKATTQSRFAGTKWERDDGTITLEFYNTGSFHETWRKKPVVGTWKVKSDNEAVLIAANGKSYHFIMSEDGKTITRNDKLTYQRTK
jgi:hypothetical protein